MKATEKQVGFAMRLLRKAGYPTDFLPKRSHGKYANFRDIKAALGRVENWTD